MSSNNLKKVGSLPSWKEFEGMVEGIWEREYYTNHGPLVSSLEARVGGLLGVKHVICMTNSSIALMIALKALGINGEVVLPSFSHINIAQSVKWAGLEAEFCDVKNNSFDIDPNEIINKRNKDVELIIAINDYGVISEIDKLEEVTAQQKLKLLFISNPFFGEEYKGKKFGSFGDLEVFSFHESQLINGADGACVCTSDDLLASRLRNIRSSYGAGKQVPIPYTGNGRMSEIQAGLSLLSLDNLENKRNEVLKRKNEFTEFIEKINGVSIYNPTSVSSNFILELDTIKLDINFKDIEFKLKLINKHIELFKFHGAEIYPPFKRKDFSTNSLVNNTIGLPSNITSKEFHDVISILTQKNQAN
ncbi:DegT/DnrJ/EryC1/StrS family aminotransferase [Algibacter aquimarinus]|uniref:DegT/DnrJ/EryC1/StrS aminotransferase family protein n=1 Tax=Algibacter aquimarinus TaxID=1136748 RepID=A0ABP9HQJ7_9FLAO